VEAKENEEQRLLSSSPTANRVIIRFGARSTVSLEGTIVERKFPSWTFRKTIRKLPSIRNPLPSDHMRTLPLMLGKRHRKRERRAKTT
jgi:hypothetical protein